MSSRLVILPKKSWNVWNQDNIEKVKRDERLAAEAAAATEQRAREIEQERRIDGLKRRMGRPTSEKDTEKSGGSKRKRPAGGPAGEGQGWGGVDRHVNLFEAAELANKASGGNAEYEKEQREKELKEQRQSGLYPTALGGENPKEKPWWYGDAGSSAGYGGGSSSSVSGSGAAATLAGEARPPSKTVVRGRTLVGDDAEMAFQRDAARKAKADPMEEMVRRHNSAASGAAAVPAAAGSGARGSSGMPYPSQTGAGRARSGPCGGQRAAAPAAAAAALGSVEELRQRRLRRERGERSREASLLSRMQPWSPIPDDRDREFNSQYHPERARKKR